VAAVNWAKSSLLSVYAAILDASTGAWREGLSPSSG
jgi:hypothetical protein